MYWSEIVSVLAGLFGNVVSARYSIVYKGYDHYVQEEDTDIEMDEMRSEKIGTPISKDELAEAIKDKEARKLYHVLKKGYTVETGPKTISESWLESIRSIEVFGIKIGKVLAPFLDFLFSPNFLRTVTVLGAIFAVFSPAGPIVGGIGLGLCLASVGYAVVRDVLEYRDVVRQRERFALLKEISETRKAIIEKATALNMQQSELMKLLNIISPCGIGAPTKQSFLSSAHHTMMGDYALIGFNTAASIATLSPISILWNLFGITLAAASATRHEHEFLKLKNSLGHIIALQEDSLGMKTVSNTGLAFHMHSFKALKSVMEEYETSDDNIEGNIIQKFNEVCKNLPALDKIETEYKATWSSFFSDMWKMLSADMSWVDRNRKMSPMLTQKSVLEKIAVDFIQNNTEKSHNLGEHHQKAQELREKKGEQESNRTRY